jgi:hypothetical protein
MSLAPRALCRLFPADSDLPDEGLNVEDDSLTAAGLPGGIN